MRDFPLDVAKPDVSARFSSGCCKAGCQFSTLRGYFMQRDALGHRGYQMIQKIIRNDKIDGVEIDRNLTVNDSFGQSVIWLTSEQFNGELRTSGAGVS